MSDRGPLLAFTLVLALAGAVALGRTPDPARADQVLSTGRLDVQIVAYTGPPLARPDDDAIALAAHQRLWGDTRHSLAWPLEEAWADDGRSVTVRARVGAGWGLADRPIGPRLVVVCLDATAPRLRYREVAYLPPTRRPTPAKPRLAWDVELPEWAARPCFGGLWWGTGRVPGRPDAPEWAGGVAWVGEEPEEAR